MKPAMRIYLLLFVPAFLLSACVTKRQYQELEQSKNYYEMEAARIDSLEYLRQQALQEKREVEGYYKNALYQIEQLTVANKSLNDVYQELLLKYNRQIEQGRNLLSTSSYEKQNLVEQLSAYQAELDRKERYLTNLELELTRKEERLNQAQQQDLRGDLAQRDLIIQQLQSQLARKDATVQQIKQNLSQALGSYSQSDLSVTEKRGKLYVSMSQNLLFSSGSTQVNKEGKRALQQLAGALKNNPDIDIMVEGHTDTDGPASKNWDLSVMRSTAVIKELTASGVDPYRLTAAGRAFYDPVAANNTDSGKALNRRTEIVISPKLDELMDLINQ